ACAHGHLVRPARRERHSDGEALVVDHGPRIVGDEGAPEAATLALTVETVCGELLRRDRRKMVERVDLSVGVRERRTGFDAAVLEREDELVPLVRPQLPAAVGPDRK